MIGVIDTALVGQISVQMAQPTQSVVEKSMLNSPSSTRRHDRDGSQQAENFRNSICLRRKKAQRPIKKIAKRLMRDDLFQTQVDKLLRRVRYRGRKKNQRFGIWAKVELKTVFKNFCKAQPCDTKDLVTLHRFRIKAKQLRYAMDLLAPAFGPEFPQQLYPTVEQLQKMLGHVNDHAVALARLERWYDEKKRGMNAQYFHRLLNEENAQLDRSIGAFWEWWTEERQQEMTGGFESVFSS